MVKRDMNACQVDKERSMCWDSNLELGFPEFPVWHQDTRATRGTCMRLRSGREKMAALFFFFLNTTKICPEPKCCYHSRITRCPYLDYTAGATLAPTPSLPGPGCATPWQRVPAAAGHIHHCSPPPSCPSFLPNRLSYWLQTQYQM